VDAYLSESGQNTLMSLLVDKTESRENFNCGHLKGIK
jgi:hypothetical protein